METRDLPERQYLAHPSPIRQVNQPTIVFLTVCIAERRPLLNSQFANDLVIAAWRSADRWSVGRYVILPEHIHVFCAPNDDRTPLKLWVQFWRNLVTRKWPNPTEKPIWQRDFWDRQLRSGESYSDKWEYVRQNPVRAGLVDAPERWPYQGELSELRW